MFLPAAGYRTPDGTANQYAYGHYWSSTAQSIEIGYNLRFSSSLVEPSSTFSNHSDAFTVRCVRPAEPPLAAPGMIGYIKGTNELTLKGSKEYASHAGIKAYADATFGGLSDKTVYVAYFQFGSLVALSSDPSDRYPNAGGTYLESDDILAGPWEWPGFNALKDNPVYANIPSYTAADYTAGRLNISATTYHNATFIAQGKGDPCMYYFGNRYNGGWKLPTGSGYNTSNPIYNGNAYNAGNFVWKNEGELGTGLPSGRLSSIESGVFYPTTATRLFLNDGRYRQGGGYFRTSLAYNTIAAYSLDIYSDTNPNPMLLAANYHADGLAVRCVR